MTSQMPNYSVWAGQSRPKQNRQRPPVIEHTPVLRGWFEKLQRLFRPPILPFWILSEIIEALRTYPGYPNEPVLLPLDVCFHKSWATKLVNRITFNDFNDLSEDEDKRLDSQLNRILAPLSEWLTFQIACYRADENRRMDVCVRCLLVDEDLSEVKNSNLLICPQRKTRWILRSFEKVWTWLTSQVFTTSLPIFWLRMPPLETQIIVKKVTFHGETPHLVLPEIPIQAGKLVRIGRDQLPVSTQKRLPLVEDSHVELTIVCFPTDQACQLWVRHLGMHELWITTGKAVEEYAWQQIGRGAWHPVQEKQRLLLGRRTGIENNVYRNLPGSLVICVDKIGG